MARGGTAALCGRYSAKCAPREIVHRGPVRLEGCRLFLVDNVLLLRGRRNHGPSTCSAIVMRAAGSVLVSSMIETRTAALGGGSRESARFGGTEAGTVPLAMRFGCRDRALTDGARMSHPYIANTGGVRNEFQPVAGKRLLAFAGEE
jgi:hypothetical protein